MDKKLIGTAAVIGVVAGYMYSKDVFNAAKPYSSRKADEKHCKKLKKYITIPTPNSRIAKEEVYYWRKIIPLVSKGESKGWYEITTFRHWPAGTYKKYKGTKYTGSWDKKGYNTKLYEQEIDTQNRKPMSVAMAYAQDWGGYVDMQPEKYIWDTTGHYCKMLECGSRWDDNTGTCPEKPVTEKPSNQDEEEETTVVPVPSNEDDEGTTTTSTNWCAVKGNSPTWIKEIEGEMAEERLKIKKDLTAAVKKATKDSKELSAKLEKDGAAELKKIKARYEESKKKCSAKEEVQKKLQDSGAGEGFWEKLLAFLNA